MQRCASFLQVSLAKPLGVRFARGNDGGAYVVRTDAKLGSTDPQIEVSIHAPSNTHVCCMCDGPDIWYHQVVGFVCLTELPII